MDTTMQRKTWLPGGVVLGAFLAAVLLGSLAVAQTVPPATEQTAEVVELLRRGRQLEIERRWADALVHYEDAVRQFPGDASLQRRFQFTRLHYDLQRRYDDRSYRELLSRLSLAEALDVYSEVLLKIQAHYVEAPHWKELVERGTNSFEVALSESAFLETHAPGVESKAVDEFRRELRRVLGPRVIQTRGDARDAVATAAMLAQSRLGVPPRAVVLEYLCGATNALDAYSSYLTPAQLNDIQSQIEGNFVGLGVELKADEGALLIVRVIPGSPAERCGICAGDRITSVDGQSTRELTTDQAASLLQGQAGSVAELTIVSSAGQTRQASISRERVEVPSVEDVRLVDRDCGIGYLKLSSFQKTTSRDVDTALWELHRAGMQGLIVDLRTNPGGLLVAAVEVADKFVDRGVIVATRGRNVQENFTYSAHEIGTWRMPLVVLIDHESASAAEIFAGAIRDLRRGTIVGTRSYGKGLVQSIFRLNVTDSGVRLTTAKFYSPTGHPYSQVGVQPDVLVHHVARPIGVSGQLPPSAEEDPVLSAGLQAARQLIAQPVGARVETVR
jgi:carboxyl-terminal processing protease